MYLMGIQPLNTSSRTISDTLRTSALLHKGHKSNKCFDNVRFRNLLNNSPVCGVLPKAAAGGVASSHLCADWVPSVELPDMVVAKATLTV